MTTKKWLFKNRTLKIKEKGGRKMKRIHLRHLTSWYAGFGAFFVIFTLIYWIIGAGFVGEVIVADNNVNDFNRRCFEAGIAGIEVNSSSADCVVNFQEGHGLRNLVYSDDAEERLQSFNNLFPVGRESVILRNIGEQVSARGLRPEEITIFCGLDATLRRGVQNVCEHQELLSYLTEAPQNFDVPDDDEKFYPRVLLWIGLGIYVIFGLIFMFSYFPLNIKNYYAIPGDRDSWEILCMFLPFWLGGMALIAAFHLPLLAFAGGYGRVAGWNARKRRVREETEKYGKDVVNYLGELNALQAEVEKEKNNAVRTSLLQIIASARNDVEIVKSKRAKRLSEVKEEVRDKFNLAERIQSARDRATAMREAEEE